MLTITPGDMAVFTFLRAAMVALWNALCVFLALWYLMGAPWKAALVAFFVLLSSALGYGGRWVMAGGFLLSVVAIAVFLGFPAPGQWADIAKSGANSIIVQSKPDAM